MFLLDMSSIAVSPPVYLVKSDAVQCRYQEKSFISYYLTHTALDYCCFSEYSRFLSALILAVLYQIYPEAVVCSTSISIAYRLHRRQLIHHRSLHAYAEFGGHTLHMAIYKNAIIGVY